MRISWIWLLAAGCATSSHSGPREETPLEKLRAKTNAYTSFHYKAELTDGKVSVPIELAWRAPDRALLRYGLHYTVILAEGVEHRFEKKSTCALAYGEMIDSLRREYGDLLPGPPRIAFVLGNWDLPMRGQGLLAALDVRLSGSRLGWIDEILARPKKGDLHEWGLIQWELREDGFLERVTMGSSASLAMKELTIDQPLDDALFALPASEGMIDLTDSRKGQRMQQLEESFHRWVLEARPDAAAIDALVKTDLARRVEPAKMIEFQRKSLEESLESLRKQEPPAPPQLIREKIELARGKTLASVEVMEEDLQKDFARRLDRYLSGRPPPEVAERWRAAVARQIDLQIRKPLGQVFTEKLP